MQLTKNATGNLINRYKAVLKKCHVLNTFGSLAIAAMLISGGAGFAAANTEWKVGGDATSSMVNGGNASGNIAGQNGTNATTSGRTENLSNITITNANGNSIVVGGAGSAGGAGGQGSAGGSGADGTDGMDGSDGGAGANSGQGGAGAHGAAGIAGADGAASASGGNGGMGAQGGAGTTNNVTLSGNFDSITVGGTGATAGTAGNGGEGGSGGAGGDGGTGGNLGAPASGIGGFGGNGGNGGDGGAGQVGGIGGNAEKGGAGGAGTLTITGGSGSLGTFGVGSSGGVSTAGGTGGDGGDVGANGAAGTPGAGLLPPGVVTGGDGKMGQNGGKGGNGAQGGAGGAGVVSITGGSFTANTITVGGAGSDGGTGGTGGAGGNINLGNITNLPGVGGIGGIGGDGATGGNGSLSLSGNSSLSGDSILLGGNGGNGGTGGAGGDSTLSIGGAGGAAGAAGVAGAAILTITESASLYAGVLTQVGGNGGAGGAGGNAGGMLAIGGAGADGKAGAKGGAADVLMNGGTFATLQLNVGGDGGVGGAGGNGGALTTGQGGTGAAGADGGQGFFMLNAGKIFVETALNLGGNAADGGAAGTGTGAGTGGTGGAGGSGLMELNGGSGSLAAVQLGGTGATAGIGGVGGVGGGGGLTVTGGQFVADSMVVGGKGGNASGALFGSDGGLGIFAMSGGTFAVAGDTQLGGSVGAGGAAGDGGVGIFSVTGGTYATKTFTVAPNVRTEFTIENVAGEAKAVTIVGTDDVDFLRNSSAINVMEGVHGAKYTGVLGLTAQNTALGGTTLDLSRVNAVDIGDVATTGLATTSLTVIDAKSYVDNAGSVALNVGMHEVEAGASLMLIGDNQLRVGDSFTAMEGVNLETSGTWTQENLISSSRLLTAGMSLTDGAGNAGTTHNQITMAAADPTKTMSGTNQSTAGLLMEMAHVRGVDSTADHAGVRYFSRASDMRFIAKGEESARIIASAMQMASAAGVQTSTLSTVTAGNNAVLSRASTRSALDNPRATAMNLGENGQVSLDSGMSAGDTFKNGFGLWINPLYQSDNTYNQKSEGYRTGVNSNLAGVAVGADYSFMEMFRTGIALMLGGGYAQSNGDFLSSKNNFSFWGVTGYGSMQHKNFGLVADLGYTSTFNKVRQSTPENMYTGDLKADMFSSALSAGLRGDYRFETNALDIIPHVGARFTGLTTDKHSVKGDGGTMLDVEQMYQNIWTFPVGVTLEKKFETSTGWLITPMVDLGVIFAAGDLDAKSKSRMPGFATQASNTTAVVDGTTFDGALGFEIKKNDLSVGINYNLQLSEHRTGHGVNVMLGYEF